MSKESESDVVSKTVCLPGDLMRFAEGKTKKIAKKLGERPNLSRYVRELIRRDKEEEEKRDREAVAA